jgi:hypothetical protein
MVTFLWNHKMVGFSSQEYAICGQSLGVFKVKDTIVTLAQ